MNAGRDIADAAASVAREARASADWALKAERERDAYRAALCDLVAAWAAIDMRNWGPIARAREVLKSGQHVPVALKESTAPTPAPSGVDWSTMTPRAIFDALQTAPRVAGPWAGSNADHYNHCIVTARFSAVADDSGSYLAAVCRDESERAATDTRLREEGWLLFDDAKAAPPPPEPRCAVHGIAIEAGAGICFACSNDLITGKHPAPAHSAEEWLETVETSAAADERLVAIRAIQANARNAALMAKGCVERQAMIRVGDHRLDYSKCAGCGLGMQVEKAVGEVAPVSRLVNADNCPTCRLGPPTRHCGKRYPGWSCQEPLGHEGDCLPLVRFTPEDFAALAEYFDE